MSHEYIKQKMVSRIEYLYNNHCNLGLYDEKEFRVFSNHLKQEIPEIMEMAELRCGDNNESNFISKYNNGKLSIGVDVQDRQSLYIHNKSSLLKNGIKICLKAINYLLLTYRV